MISWPLNRPSEIRFLLKRMSWADVYRIDNKLRRDKMKNLTLTKANNKLNIEVVTKAPIIIIPKFGVRKFPGLGNQSGIS